MSNARDAARAVDHIKTSAHHVIVITHYPPSEVERQAFAQVEPALWLHGHSHLFGIDQPMVQEWSRRADPPQACISSDYLSMIPVEVTGGLLHPNV